MDTSVAIFFIQFVLLFSATLAQNINFSYTGTTGPEKWGSLSPNFSMCSKGKLQSPINIEKKDLFINGRLQPLIRDYVNPLSANLSNNRVSIVMRFGAGSGVLIVDGKKYNLAQMHWHSPSEHTLDGVRYAVELHQVHKATDGSVSVVAVLFQHGDPDPFIAEIMDHLKKLGKEKAKGIAEAQIPIGKIKINQMERKIVKYVRYTGSLTTPPCTENVIWNVLGKVKSISKEQIEALKAPLDSSCKSNFRPTQPVNGRREELYDHEH